MSENRTYYFELIDVVHFVVRWKKPLIWVSMAAAILSTLVSSPLVITPRFLSTAVFYPTTNNSISSALLTDNKVKNKDPLEFGEQVAAQQFVQILESDQLKARVIKCYQLFDRYKVSQDDPEKNYKIGKLYEKYITVRKTPYASIEVSVLDIDPQMAANIANGIVLIADSIKTEVQRTVARQALSIIEQQYTNKVNEITDIENRMKEIGRKGVYSFEDQSEAVTVLASKGASDSYIKKQQEALAEYGSEAHGLKSLLEYETESLSELRIKLEKSKVDVESTMSNVFIINHAQAADKKASPIRWLIVLISTIGSFLAACFIVLILEKYAHQKSDRLA